MPRPNYIQWLIAFSQPQFSFSVLKSRFGKLCRTAITFFLKPRIFSPFSPKVSKSFLEMPQALLQRYATNLVEKIEFFGFFPISKKTRGLFVINPLLLFVPSFGSGSQSFVIDQTHTTHCPSQKIFLRWCWVKAKFVGTFSHASHFSAFNVKFLVEARIPLVAKARVSFAQIQDEAKTSCSRQ
jgi:hypothetical protein